MPDHDLLRLERENVRRIREADTPLDGCTSWVDYATRHVHAGSRPCWQCAARERALGELAETEAQLDVTVRDCNEWQADAERNRAAYAEAMIRESRARERITELEREVRKLRDDAYVRSSESRVVQDRYDALCGYAWPLMHLHSDEDLRDEVERFTRSLAKHPAGPVSHSRFHAVTRELAIRRLNRTGQGGSDA